MTAPWPRFHSKTGLVFAAAMLLGAFVPALAEDDDPKPTVRIGNSTLEPVDWQKLDGWAQDDHAAAFATFMASCKAILRASATSRPERPVFRGLHQACTEATQATISTAQE